MIKILEYSALAKIDRGDVDGAMEDIRLQFRVFEASGYGLFTISQLTHIACGAMIVETINKSVHTGKLNDAHLDELKNMLTLEKGYIGQMERAAQADTASRNVRAVERQANRHWTLVWLSQRTWRGRGILVDTRGRRGLLVCPDIGLETWVNVGEGPATGTQYDVVVGSVDLPRLDLHVELSPAG